MELKNNPVDNASCQCAWPLQESGIRCFPNFAHFPGTQDLTSFSFFLGGHILFASFLTPQYERTVEKLAENLGCVICHSLRK